MKITVKRNVFTEKSTISDVLIDGKFICYALEDKTRGPNEPHPQGATSIPYGEYQVHFRQEGGMYFRYRDRFKDIRQERGILHLYNIKDNKYDKWYAFPGVLAGACVYIHCGNTDADTLGCLLLGNVKETDKVTGSWDAYKLFYVLVADALEKNETVTIEYIKG